jgi:hypothetical protein
MRSQKALWLAGLLVIPLLLAGCGLASSKKNAEAVVNRHFQAIATNGFAVAMADYAPEFFRQTKQEEWQKALSRVHDKLGAYKSHAITNWRIFTQAGSLSSGTTAILQCDVTYAKYSATERFTLFKGLAESEYRITSHNINSNGLLIE